MATKKNNQLNEDPKPTDCMNDAVTTRRTNSENKTEA